MNLTPGESATTVDSPAGPLDATWWLPPDPVAVLVLAHGAGADHKHKNMQALASHFAAAGLATLRFNFPYMQAGKRHVDKQEVAIAAIAAAAARARELVPELPLYLAGHSFGGRMSTHAAAVGSVDCAGLVLCSFPLHQPKKPSIKRAEHLADVPMPMLFLSGTRDDLADSELLDGVVTKLSNARVHWLETGNHSYVVLKRTRQNPLSIFEEMAREARTFVDETRN